MEIPILPFLNMEKKITKEMKLQWVLLQSHIFDKSKQIRKVDIQYQPKMNDNLPWCVKAR